jgi:hypothetical protein
LIAYQDQFEILIFAERSRSRAHDNLGAEVTAHRIQR